MSTTTRRHPRSGLVALARFTVLGCALLLVALPTAAQGDEDEGYRDNLYTNDNGEALVVWSPEGSDDVSLELRVRSPAGGEMTLASDGQAVSTSAGTETLVGFGSNPGFNNNGVAVFKGGIEYDGDAWEDDDACGIFRATTGGLTLVAEGRGDDPVGTGDGTPNGQAIAGDTLCDFEPMPDINDAGQIVFGAHMDRGDEAANGVAVLHYDFNHCGSRNWDEARYIDAQNYPHERKGLFRWSSGSGLQMLVRAYDDTIFVANSGTTADYVNADTTYEITNLSFTHTGGDIITSAGHSVAKAWLDTDTTDDSSDTNTRTNCGSCVAGVCDCDMYEAWRDDYDSIMYLRGPGDYLTVAATTPPGGGSIFQELDRPVVNDSGQVVFVGAEGSGASTSCGYADGYCSDEDWISINRWTVAGGRQEIVSTNDQAPNSDYYYQGITPHHSINNNGEVAFVAGLGDTSDPETSYECGQGVYYWNGSQVVEIVRAMDDWWDFETSCPTDTGGPFVTSFNGLTFHEIGSMASIEDSGWVFFVVENYDDLSSGPCAGTTPDDDEITSLLGWHPTFGMVEIMREGFEYEGRIVNRIYAPQPEMRNQTYAGRFAATVVFDDDRDCVSGDPDDETEIVVPLPQEGAEPIPTLGPAARVLLVLLLAAVGVLVIRRLL